MQVTAMPWPSDTETNTLAGLAGGLHNLYECYTINDGHHFQQSMGETAEVTNAQLRADLQAAKTSSGWTQAVEQLFVVDEVGDASNIIVAEVEVFKDMVFSLGFVVQGDTRR